MVRASHLWKHLFPTPLNSPFSRILQVGIKYPADTPAPDLEIGNKSHPNEFSNNLLNNIGNLTGTKPIIRVGGNTQDYALYDPNLSVATNGTNTAKSQDYPTILSIGPSFFDSYSTWPDTTFIHGFNLGKNGTGGFSSLLATVPLACKALEGGKLAYWELGNEPGRIEAHYFVSLNSRNQIYSRHLPKVSCAPLIGTSKTMWMNG